MKSMLTLKITNLNVYNVIRDNYRDMLLCKKLAEL